MTQELDLTNLRKRAELPNALHGCSSDPCGSVVCQTARDRDELLTRLEQAERAVARVHALSNELSWSPNNVAIVQRYRDALDGELNA